MNRRTTIALIAALAAYAAPSALLTTDAFAAYPGERPLDLQAAGLQTYEAASAAFWTRTRPDLKCPTGIVYAVADDLQGTDVPAGSTVLGRGGDCKVILLAKVVTWLQTPGTEPEPVVNRHTAMYVLAHEDGHALGLPHTTDPSDVMYGGDGIGTPGRPVCAECDTIAPTYTEAPVDQAQLAQMIAATVAPPEPVDFRVCLPAWASRSTNLVLARYMDGRKAQARTTYRRWAKRHPRLARQQHRRGERCITVTEG